jgi:hypothetical protein
MALSIYIALVAGTVKLVLVSMGLATEEPKAMDLPRALPSRVVDTNPNFHSVV